MKIPGEDEKEMAMMHCPGCHAPVLPEAVFCDHCGASLTRSHQQPAQAASSGTECSICGVENVPGSLYCDNCGAALSQPVNTPASIPGRFVVSGTNHTFNFPSDKPELLVGRADPETRYFPDIDTTPAGGAAAGVSRRHARLTTSGGRVYIEDLGSTNFTFVNRQRLQLGQRVPLNPGDEVRLGRLLMFYDA